MPRCLASKQPASGPPAGATRRPGRSGDIGSAGDRPATPRRSWRRPYGPSDLRQYWLLTWAADGARPAASEHTTVSLLLQVLAAYVATSLTVGLLLGAALGKLIRRGDRRRQQEVA